MKLFKNLTLIIFSVILITLALNIVFHIKMLDIVNQNKISRNLAFNLDWYYLSFYPDTYDRSLKNYNAVIGDSFAVGQGDSWIKKKKKYSSVHFLKQNTSENYLNFGKPGANSISSVREFIYRYNKINDSFFLPKIEKPNKIIIYFYEGNDIFDNYNYFKKFNKNKLTLNEYVIKEIENVKYYSSRELNIYLPLYSLSKKILIERFIHNIYLPYLRPNIITKKHETKKSNLLEENFIKFEKKKNIKFKGNLETNNPGYYLEKKEINLSLDIFFQCVKYLEVKFPGRPIQIVYIPSPGTIYEWQKDLIINHKIKTNKKFSKKVRNDHHDFIINQFDKFTSENNILFKNTTPKFKKIAKENYLHGEIDPNHFSNLGYEILANAILE